MKIKKIILFFLFTLSFGGVKAQFYSLSTNALGLATGNINMELSMSFNRKWSFHAPVQYNPFVLSNNRQIRNLTIQPGVRYWMRETYVGSFIGIQSTVSRFHVGDIWNKYRYDGFTAGLGASFGKTYMINPRLNFEWELGAGVFWASYDKYRCKKCGLKIGKQNGMYILPTRIAANLVYLF
jgi:putative salt-induced outer membrane protein YdiY